MLASGALGPQVGELLEGDAAFAQAVLRKLQLEVEFHVLVRDRARVLPERERDRTTARDRIGSWSRVGSLRLPILRHGICASNPAMGSSTRGVCAKGNFQVQHC